MDRKKKILSLMCMYGMIADVGEIVMAQYLVHGGLVPVHAILVPRLHPQEERV